MKQKIMGTIGVLTVAIVATIVVLLAINRIQPEIIIMLTIFALLVVANILATVHFGARGGIYLPVIGIIQVLSGVVLAISPFSDYPDTVRMVSLAIISAGVIMVIRGVLMNWTTEDDHIQDERTKRIGTYGLSYSWYLTFFFVAAIGWILGTEMTMISGAQICLILIVLMPVSARFFQWYFNSRGDVY